MAERHAVAGLLDDEMRERVRSAVWYAAPGSDVIRATGCPTGFVYLNDKPCDGCICPFGVALGLTYSPSRSKVAELLGDKYREIIENFIGIVDSGDCDPADVYILLGVEPPDALGGAA